MISKHNFKKYERLDIDGFISKVPSFIFSEEIGDFDGAECSDDRIIILFLKKNDSEGYIGSIYFIDLLSGYTEIIFHGYFEGNQLIGPIKFHEAMDNAIKKRDFLIRNALG